MKKLLLIALIIAMPKIYCGAGPEIKTTGKSVEEIVQQAKEVGSNLLDLVKNKANDFIKIWGALPIRTGGLLPLRETIHEQCIAVLKNIKKTLENSDEIISHQQLLGLLNKLHAAGAGIESGINLGKGAAPEIYEQTREFYKKLVDTAKILPTPTKGKYTAGGVITVKSQLAPMFIRNLILLITNHNLEVTDKEQFKIIEPLTSPMQVK